MKNIRSKIMLSLAVCVIVTTSTPALALSPYKRDVDDPWLVKFLGCIYNGGNAAYCWENA